MVQGDDLIDDLIDDLMNDLMDDIIDYLMDDIIDYPIWAYLVFGIWTVVFGFSRAMYRMASQIRPNEWCNRWFLNLHFCF